MTSRTRVLPAIAMTLLLWLAGCRFVGEAPLSFPPSTAPAAVASGGASSSTSPTNAAALAQPGTPYSVDQILDAMASSRRPEGVPRELRNRQVASTLAHQAWTWDGAPWASLSISATCGPDTCSLELAGAPAEAAGADLYSFSIDPEARRVELLATDLHGYPADLEAELDAAARASMDEGRLDGLALVGARWLPPPDTDRYWLAYRSGGEEGSPSLDVLLDLASGEVLEVTEAG